MLISKGAGSLSAIFEYLLNYKFFIMAMGAIHGDHGIMAIQITEFVDGV